MDYDNNIEYDPDLEAKLYAEIYHSNETYEEQVAPTSSLQHVDSQQTLENNAKNLHNIATSSEQPNPELNLYVPKKSPFVFNNENPLPSTSNLKTFADDVCLINVNDAFMSDQIDGLESANHSNKFPNYNHFYDHRFYNDDTDDDDDGYDNLVLSEQEQAYREMVQSFIPDHCRNTKNQRKLQVICTKQMTLRQKTPTRFSKRLRANNENCLKIGTNENKKVVNLSTEVGSNLDAGIRIVTSRHTKNLLRCLGMSPRNKIRKNNKNRNLKKKRDDIIIMSNSPKTLQMNLDVDTDMPTISAKSPFKPLKIRSKTQNIINSGTQNLKDQQDNHGTVANFSAKVTDNSDVEKESTHENNKCEGNTNKVDQSSNDVDDLGRSCISVHGDSLTSFNHIENKIVNDDPTVVINGNNDADTDADEDDDDIIEEPILIDNIDSVTIEDSSSDSSDSEESILEIPVPPKPKPPVINLHDSCDSFSSDEKEEENPVVILATDGRSASPLANPYSEVQTIEIDDDDDDDEEKISICTDPSKIILNCTSVETGAVSLDEIRRMKESDVIHDDDSMTDSEALNWGRIEGQMHTEKRSLPGDDSIDDDNIDFRQSFHQKWDRNVNKTANNSQPNGHLQKNIQQGIDSSDSDNTAETKRFLSDTSVCHDDGKILITVDNCANNNKNKNSENAIFTAGKFKKNVKSTIEMSFEEYVFQPMSKTLRAFYDEFQNSDFMKDLAFVQSQMPRNPRRWAILEADMLGPSRFDRKKTCALCHGEGHRRDRCPEKRRVVVCHMCGEYGHYEPRCPHKMCLTCGTKYSTYRKTCEICRYLMCDTCKSVGHLSNNCPDLWRRYHQTTNYDINVPSDPQSLLKSPNKLACCNCAKRGHDSSMCTRYRWSQHFTTPRFVTNYNQPPFYPRDDLSLQESFTADVEPGDSYESTAKSESNRMEEFMELPAWDLYPATDPDDNPSNDLSEFNTILWRRSRIENEKNIKNWLIRTIRPKSIPGVRFTFYKKDVPHVLKIQVPAEIEYEVTLKSCPVAKQFVFVIKMENNPMNKGIIDKLERLIVQWLERKHEDRLLMYQEKRLPSTIKVLLWNLKNKWKTFLQHVSLPGYSKLLRKIQHYKSQERATGKTHGVMHTMQKLKQRLVACSYYHLYLNNAKQVLHDFQTLLKKLKNMQEDEKIYVPHDVYLDAAWFNYELFTPHWSHYIVTAARKYCTETEESNESDSNFRDKLIEETGDIQIIDLLNDSELTHEDGHKKLTRRQKEIRKSMCGETFASLCNDNCYIELCFTVTIPSKGFYKWLKRYADALLVYVENNNLNEYKEQANYLVQCDNLKRSHVLDLWKNIKETMTTKNRGKQSDSRVALLSSPN